MTRLLNLFAGGATDSNGISIANCGTHESPRRGPDQGRTLRARSPETSEPRARRRAPGAGSRAGVVGDTRWQDPSQPPSPVIYAASAQGAGNSLAILARTSLDEASLAGSLRKLLYNPDPTVPVKFETMEELFDSALAYPRFRTQVIGLFAGVSAILAAVGIFGVLA